ncbi:MAG: GtrA family protein [Candidatus Acidiferrales bacterium]
MIFPLGMIAAARVGAWLSRRFAVVGPLSKFGIVGVLNTAIDLSLLTFLVLVTGVPRGPLYALFKATSFLAAASNSYLWNRHWSFAPTRAAGTGRPVLEAREFVRFLLLTAVGLGMSTTVATILVEIYQPLPPSTAAVWATGAGAIASVASAVWDFCAYRYLVFKWAVPIGRPLPSHRNSTIELTP